jgi:dolichol kinase
MNEYLRKIAHLLIGLLIAGIIWIFPKDLAGIIIGVSLLTGLCLIDLSMKNRRIPGITELLGLLERDTAFPGKGALFFVTGSFITLVLFPSPIAAISVAVLAVLDSCTAIFGTRFGRHRIYNGKTFEGFFAGIAVTAAFLLFAIAPAQALIIALVAGTIELVSPIDDNLVIPPVVAFLLYLNTVLHPF